MEVGPPTWPPSGSSGELVKLAPVLYVCPYASITGAHPITFKKLQTYGFRGALPETINLQFPPKSCLVLLKTSLSHRK